MDKRVYVEACRTKRYRIEQLLDKAKMFDFKYRGDTGSFMVDDCIMIHAEEGINDWVKQEILRATSLCANDVRLSESEEITDEEIEAYSIHKNLGYRYIKLMWDTEITPEMFKKVDAWYRMFRGTDKISEISKQSKQVERFLVEMNGSTMVGTPISGDSEVAEGIKRIYEIKAHKINDTMIKRCNLLRD